jgi:hypothetical protein
MIKQYRGFAIWRINARQRVLAHRSRIAWQTSKRVRVRRQQKRSVRARDTAARRHLLTASLYHRLACMARHGAATALARLRWRCGIRCRRTHCRPLSSCLMAGSFEKRDSAAVALHKPLNNSARIGAVLRMAK